MESTLSAPRTAVKYSIRTGQFRQNLISSRTVYDYVFFVMTFTVTSTVPAFLTEYLAGLTSLFFIFVGFLPSLSLSLSS